MGFIGTTFCSSAAENWEMCRRTGLTAELLKHAPEEFLNTLLTLYNNVLVTGERPESWCKTLFSMLPKKTKPLQPADFRPIANIRLLYKSFAYLLLRRLEQFLEAGQPEEQHGFRPGRRLEEHLVTANLVLDKADAVGIPVWIISLDLSKAFDRVHWPALWTALVDEGIPVHLVWILQCTGLQRSHHKHNHKKRDKRYPSI